MANPVVITCNNGVWTRVAANTLGGTIYNMTPHVQFMQTYRMAGQDAPADDLDAVDAFFHDFEPLGISSSSAIDVYLKALADGGKVRVDL